MKFVATGDSLITRKIKSNVEVENALELSNIINEADAKITNLEMTISYNEGNPGAISGGFHMQTTPDRLDSLLSYGFNLFGTANNHSLDYNYSGLEMTEYYLNLKKMKYSGTGSDLNKASAPVYLKTEQGTVALISACSSMHKTWRAGQSRTDQNTGNIVKGRPGVNQLRHQKLMTITEDQFYSLKEVADKTEVNQMVQMMIDQGFIPDYDKDKLLPFGTDMYGYNMIFQKGTEAKVNTKCNNEDLERINNSIKEANKKSDFVVVSVHGHEMKTMPKHEKTPFNDERVFQADFLEEAAHSFIDSGADAVVMHGSHVLRGIEIYKGKPIFHSLGNFIFQQETLDFMPEEFYAENRIPSDLTIDEAMEKLSKKKDENGNFVENPYWLSNDPTVMSSIFPVWEMDDNKKLISITLHPIDLSPSVKFSENGFPKLSNKHNPLETIKALSELYGTRIVIEGNVGKVVL